MVTRIFAVLAAVFLVGAVGLAALVPFRTTLGFGLVQVDPGSPAWLQTHSLPWIWDYIELPFLTRPLWLLPACMGFVCAGLAGSFNLGKSTKTRHRRS